MMSAVAARVRPSWAWLRVALFCALAPTFGCSALRPPLTCPEHGGPDWLDVTSEHFRMKTDLPESVAREHLAQFEQSFQILNELAFRSKDPPTGRVDVIVFGSLDDYSELAPPGTAGYFTEVDIDRHPLIVMYGPFSDRAREIFQHELTHRFVRHFMPTGPIWLNEGLASFYETVTTDGDSVVIGEAGTRWRFDAGSLMTPTPLGWVSVELPSVTELLGASPAVFRESQRATSFYASSWLVVSMLKHGPEQYERRFWSFVDGLVEGQKVAAAWQNSFDGMPTAELDEALRNFVQKGEIVVERVRFSPRPMPVQMLRTMSDDEIHTLWAQIRIRAGAEQRRKARDELAQVIARSPRFAEARHTTGMIALAEGRTSDAEVQFRAAVAVRPDDERYLQGLCTAIYKQEIARSPAVRDLTRLTDPVQRLATLARSAAALNAVGWIYAELDRPDEGWAFAERSLRVNRSCATCLDTLALLAFMKGRVRDALDLQRQALSLLPESSVPEGWLDRLRQYERAAKAERPTSTAP